MSIESRICGVVSLFFLCAVALQTATAAEEEEKKSPWKARSELSYVKTGGNSDTQTFSGLVETSLDLTPNRYFLSGGGVYGEEDSTANASRWVADARYERAFTERFFGTLNASYLKDTFAGYDSKIAAGPGLGYDIVKTDAHFLKGLTALLYTWDNTTDDQTDDYVTWKVAGDYTWQILENLKFKQYADYVVSLDDTAVWFVNSTTRFEVKLTSIFSVITGFGVNYQNEPPNGKDETDTRFFTSLAADY